jgi:hypothetical protein
MGLFLGRNVMQVDQQVGDFTFRVEKKEDGTLNVTRRLNNTLGARFEPVPSHEIPRELLLSAQNYDRITRS